MVSSVHPVSENEKRECLEAVLGSATFARSAQLRALLRYICEREMAGHSEELTEYQIAVDVLGRRKMADPDDGSVRNRAYELRQRLERYYANEKPQAPIRIEIPRGGYVPVYTRQPETAPVVVEPAAPPANVTVVAVPVPAAPRVEAPSQRPWRIVAAALALLAIGMAAGALLRPAPRPPAILKEAWGPLADPSGEL